MPGPRFAAVPCQGENGHIASRSTRRRRKKILLGVAALIATAAVAPRADAAPGMIVGFDEAAFLRDSSRSVPVAQRLGATAIRVSLGWNLYQTQLTAPDATALRTLTGVASAGGMRIVLSVAASSPNHAPLDALGRSSYCGYLANIVKRFTTIKDVVVWNEPNLSLFWRPQFNPDGTPAAPKAYEALLAECYDDLHAVQPQVNVIAPATCPRGTDIAWESTSISVS